MKLLKGGAILAFAGTAIQLSADNGDGNPPAGITYTSTLVGNLTGSLDLKDEGKALGGVSSTSLSEKLAATLPTSETSTLSVGLSYKGCFFDVEHEGAAPMFDKMQSLSFDIMSQWALNADWALLGGGSLGFSNSGNSFNSDGLGGRIFVGATRNFSPSLSATFGVAYTSLARDSHKFLPVAGIRYAYSPEWTLSVGFPETALVWTPSREFDLALVVDMDMTTAYVDADDLSGNSGANAIGGGKMEYEAVRAGLRGNYRLTENLTLTAGAGYLFASHLDFYEADYKLESDGGAPYGSLAIKVRF